MEKKLLEVFEIANELNDKQSKVYAQITYTANDTKELEVSIRNKDNFTFLEKCKIQLINQYMMKLDTIIAILKNYSNIGGSEDE